MEEQDHKNIKGWGIDANPENDPVYPLKKRTNEEHEGYTWDRPPQQPENIEVLISNERPDITSVFGTSTPPSGLSGKIRRYAFRYSESSYGHWLPLLLADRVNMVEGLIDDLRRGHIPNIIAERGWTGEWKYNRKGLIEKVVVGAVVATAFVALLSLQGGGKRKRKV